jgi:hypothetical protein
MATTTLLVEHLSPVEKPRGCKFSRVQIQILKEWLRSEDEQVLHHLTFKRIVAYKREKRSVNIGHVKHALADIGYTLEEIQPKSAREIAQEVVDRMNGSFDDDDDDDDSSSSHVDETRL